MVQFNSEYIEMFLGVIRKYMQLRGGLSQKDLAQRVNVGISTMSRFLNQKTKEYDAQMMASIVAVLNIPLHEIIDFISEDSTETFKKLVSFYKDNNDDSEESTSLGQEHHKYNEEVTKTKTTATIKGVKVPFGESREVNDSTMSIKDKLGNLSPRQKGFLTDFLNLDVEGRDLIVDIGNQLFRYFKQSNADF